MKMLAKAIAAGIVVTALSMAACVLQSIDSAAVWVVVGPAIAVLLPGFMVGFLFGLGVHSNGLAVISVAVDVAVYSALAWGFLNRRRKNSEK